MNLDEIRELIKLATETHVAELEVQRGDVRVRIRLSHPAEAYNPAPIYHPVPVSVPGPSAASQPATPPPPPVRASEKPAGPPSDGTVLVKSPIVGTFYECSAPGAPPFVRVGESVQPGKVLCIIESMKLMNEIEAEVAGVIEAKLVPNGQPVEYGEALFVIRPV
ncbi:MAG TPA: acetyl-CoA carboxylase biotin carboxyl carrier protein [Bryobacteraceae bacterium]|jgi:acetyl-CoA carboxylase biotin carboxyl carrier protein